MTDTWGYVSISPNTAPATFTVAELWMLNDSIRHELEDQETWQHPPSDRDLNREIAHALSACAQHGLSEFTLELNEHAILVIDFTVRRDMKTVEGAKGEQILLKTYVAWDQLEGDKIGVIGDVEWTEEMNEALNAWASKTTKKSRKTRNSEGVNQDAGTS